METKKQTILDIMKKSGIKDASFCAFLPLLPYLIDCRAKMRIPKNAKTVITCIFPYKVKEEKPKNISRYAAVPDYHIVLSKYLSSATINLKKEFPEYEFSWFSDNSPIPEVYAACVSGLGVKGDNGLLINEKYGSFVFIGEIVTDLEIECKNNFSECLHCEKCKTVCPKTEKNECLSFVTQKKGELSDAEISAIKKSGVIWGCDICSEVCPLNEGKEKTYIPEFLQGYKDKYEINDDIENRAFAWRGEKVIKRNFNL
ncbi:MAG: DUF1730 domain-containing protein [Clostridia bacterium]|nr:DUF1730 domain-containing protein [Clostridia bacterium]